MENNMEKAGSPANQVYTYIRNQIATRQIYPGNRIVEEDVAKKLGVSRTPIRTAFSRLNYEGLIDLVPNKGAFVAMPTVQDLKNVYEMRGLLEVQAFRNAVKCGVSEECKEKMRENLQKQAQLQGRFDLSVYANLNREFHMLIAEQSGNPYCEKFLRELHNKTNASILFLDTSSNNDASLQNHSNIFRALCDRDEEAGVAAIRADLEIWL